MKILLNKLISLLNNITSGMAALGGVILVFCMLIVTAEVAMRSIFNVSQAWLMQIIEYSLLYITFLGVAWVMRKEGHVKMDLLLNRLKIRPREIIISITSVLSAVTFLIIAWYGAQVTWDFFLRGYFDYKVIDVPKAYIIVVIPLGSFVLAIELVRRAKQHMQIWRESKKH